MNSLNLPSVDMRKFCSIFIVVFIFFLGCENSKQSRPSVQKDVTVRELIANQQFDQIKAKTIALGIYTFQISSARLPEIQNLICRTNTLPLAYNAKEAFSLNGLIACSGDKNDWQRISGAIFKSTPRIAKSVSLYAVEDVNDDVAITQIPQQESVLYYAGQDKTTGIGLDGGQIMLRIKTSSLIGLRQVCRVDITPVYKGIKSPVNQDGGEFIFESAQVAGRLGVGQFVLIAPAAVRAGQGESRTLGDLICYPQKPGKTVNVYLINCNQIKEPMDFGGQK